MTARLQRVVLFVLTSALLADAALGQSGTRRRRYIPRRSPPTRAATTKPLEGPRVDLSRPLIALDGYDAVTLRNERTLTLGSDEFQSLFDDQTYRFATGSTKAQFDAAPQQFAPALGGASVVALVDEQQVEPAGIEQSSVAQGRLFLFADAVEKVRFESNPARYAEADLLLDGMSPVSLVERSKLAPGKEEFAVVFQGCRIRFVDDAERQKFLEDPGRYYPTLGGLDPVEALRGTFVFGRPQFAVVYKNRLYVMRSDENRKAFIRDARSISDLDVTAGGICPVTLAEQKRAVAGHYGISTIYRGRRYLFASEANRRKFRENPRRYDVDANDQDQAAR